LVSMYTASKTLYQKSLGTESAVVIDLKGQAPALPAEQPPGTKPEKPAAWVPRIAGVYELTDPSGLADSWQVIEANLNQALKSMPLPMPLGGMTPVSSDKNGITTWFYPLPIGGNDLLPCVSVNDKVFMLGTSKSLHETLAARLQLPASTPALTGTHYRLSFAAVRTFLKNLNTATLPGVSTESASTALPWVAPFGDVRGRIWQEGDVLRQSFHLEANDLRKVD
ncbi:MAG: hypothetical protein U0984_09920, partial [Prosthecobacter sp.]|nr:hypothetical protein [Prosthecobacter sp.]